MSELDADFEISTNNFDCSFEIYAAGTIWGSITGDIENQTDLQNILTGLQDNIDTHIADTTNPHEVTKTQVGLSNVDNTSDLNKPISTATQTALDGKQNIISDLSTIRTNASNGQSAYNTIQNYGDIVTHNASDFATSIQGQKADTALQPNDDISKLNNNAGYITSASLPTVNNSTITFQKNNVTVGDINLNQSNNETINISVPTQASDINAVPTSRTINSHALNADVTLAATDVGALPSSTTINDLTTTAQQDALDSGANSTNIAQIATNTSNINSLSNTVTNNYNTLDGRITSEVSTLNTAIGTETTNRQNADNNLQSQIDAIVSSSDVFDIVGTYAELEAYDITTVPVNDIIKVLVDSTHSNAATYYRCVVNGSVKSWSYIGAEGAYYTKSESDSLFVEQTTTVNGKALSNNITLTASDVGALPSSTTIGNGILTIQKNSVDVDTFSANATSNKTINIITPTKTSDLTNDSGFIGSSALSSYATQTDLTNGLATKQDTISDLSTIRSYATNGQSAYTTIQGYGDIVTYNASNFATSAQGNLADTALQQGDDISLLNNNAGYITGITSSDVTTALGYTPYNSTNPNGYTSNVGTVTSINNTQPDANGNVTIPTGGTVDQTYDSTSANAQSGVAIAGAKFIQNNSTISGGLSIIGRADAEDDAIVIGDYGVGNRTGAISIGSVSTNAYNNYHGTHATREYAVAIGSGAQAEGVCAVCIGFRGSNRGENAITIGREAKAHYQNTIAIGTEAKIEAAGTIQLGTGTNSTANSLQVSTYQLLDTSTGLIPDARLSTNIARTTDIPSARSGLPNYSSPNITTFQKNTWFTAPSDGWICYGHGLTANVEKNFRIKDENDNVVFVGYAGYIKQTNGVMPIYVFIPKDYSFYADTTAIYTYINTQQTSTTQGGFFIPAY